MDGVDLLAAIGWRDTAGDHFTETRDVRSVGRLVVGGAAEVYFRHGEPSLTVAARAREDLAGVLTTLSGDTLAIKTRGVSLMAGGSVFVGGLCRGVIVGSGNIQMGDGVIVGSGNVQIESLAFPRTVVIVTLPLLPLLVVDDAGNVFLQELRQSDLTVEISGAGTVRADGVVRGLSVDISGAGSMSAKRLLAERADLKISGAGGIKVGVEATLKARVSGAGNIKIFGNPASRDVRASGAGEVKFKWQG